MNKLQGKVVVITGGHSGIGLASAKRFVEEGAKVVLFGRNQQQLAQASEMLGDNAYAIQGDVTHLADLKRLYEATLSRFGKVDVVFANAGVAAFAPADMADEAHFDTLSNTNFKGAFFTATAALPYLNEGANILFNTSVTNVKGISNTSVYAATKAALRSLVRTLAVEWAGKGIRVNAVSPGLTETPILSKTGAPDEAIHAFGELVSSNTPLGRLGKPVEIAEVALFLASPNASFVTGAEFAVDGGYAQV